MTPCAQGAQRTTFSRWMPALVGRADSAGPRCGNVTLHVRHSYDCPSDPAEKACQGSQEHEDWGLQLRPVELESAKIVVFLDSSWANAEDLKSQAGFMVFVAGNNVDSVQSDTDWRSHRIKQQCRSTLAAETMAMDAAMDAGLCARELLAEVLVESYQPLQAGRLSKEFMPVLAVTDCRSLRDLLARDAQPSSTQEKRLAIDIGGLKEAAAEFDPEQEQLNAVFKWIATERQLADHLTKPKPAHMLRSLLDQGTLLCSLTPVSDQISSHLHTAATKGP